MLSRKLVSTGRCTMPLVAMVASVLLSTPLPAAQFGPPPNAPLSVEKLARIDDFLNIASFAGMKVGVECKDESGEVVLDLVPLRRPVMIEDLLLHTSGITYWLLRIARAGEGRL